ncbi:MAG: cyclic nucleotide-binding domain-containing protein, partial [Flavobacteriales bacterium]|nr:cyclic nucleotide-binding domain-containing protein [Flavobacteriales bacterium]
MKNIATEVPQGCELCQSHHRSMFASLSGKQIVTLDAHKTCTRYRKGQALFHEGTRPMGLFCINRGTIKVFRIGLDGKEQIIK